MKIIFVRNDLELSSWLIRWGSHPDFGKADAISHCGILFSNGLFFHSTLSSGVYFTLFESYVRNPGLEIVATLEPKMELSELEEKQISEDLSSTYLNRNYDVFAFIELVKAFFMKKIFKKNLPLENELNSKNLLLCNEVVQALKENFAKTLNIEILSSVNDSAFMWPQKLFEILLKEPNLKGGYHD